MMKKLKIWLARKLLPFHYKQCMDIGLYKAEKLGYTWINGE